MHFISVKFIVFIVCLNVFQKETLAFDADTNSSDENVSDNFASGLKVVYRAFEQCENISFGDTVTCLMLRALKFADRILRSDSVRVIDGLSIVKTKAADRNGRGINFKPLPEVDEAVLPSDPEKKQDKLNEMMIERLARFFQTHSVQFDISRFMVQSKQLLDDYPEDEGRAKKMKGNGLLLIGGLLKGGMLAMGLKGLALLAGKALIVAKIALVLSAIIGLSKLFGSGHSEDKTTYEIVKYPHVTHSHTYSSSHVDGEHGHFDSGSDGHYRRSLQIPEAAMYPHLLAYKGQRHNQKA